MKDLMGSPPKAILILKSHPSGLETTEAFLRNRGWQVYSTADAKDALLQIVSKKFTYIMISIDHQNKKVAMLPKLIAEKFEMPVIAFAESTSAVSFNTLTEAATNYKIYAPVTGPAVERCVNKYVKDHVSPREFTLQEDQKPSEILFLTPMKAEHELSNVFIHGKRPAKGFGTVHIQQGLKSPGFQIQDTAPSPRDFRINELRKLNDANDSLIAKATQVSLKETVQVLDGYILHKVEEITTPACILVESDRFSGYLVAALGKDQKIEESFIKNIQQMLFNFLKKNGEEISETEAINLKIKQVDFEPWALEYADFLKTSVHQGNEVAMAFFPRKPIIPAFEESHHPNMLKIKLQDLQGDREVEFDLYMYLANNNKFILYTPKGGVFYGKQLERLKKQGVTHMHVQKDAVQSISKYRAQNYLNELIDDFKEKQRVFNIADAI